jgi:DNA-directed RNA polymerase specialized sigma54-like protein
MYRHRLPKNDNEEFMKHERYVEILNSIGRNTHEAQALIRKLEYRKETVKKVCIRVIHIYMDIDIVIL